MQKKDVKSEFRFLVVGGALADRIHWTLRDRGYKGSSHYAFGDHSLIWKNIFDYQEDFTPFIVVDVDTCPERFLKWLIAGSDKGLVDIILVSESDVKSKDISATIYSYGNENEVLQRIMDRVDELE